MPSKFVCQVCDFIYDESKGDPDSGIAPGTKFEDIPYEWTCPVCGANKEMFKTESKENISDTHSQTHKKNQSYFGDLERNSDEVEPEMHSIFLKAVTGKPEYSSMRTEKFENQFNQIVFLPGQLAKRSLRKTDVNINLKTIIGPNAKKPLTIALPFFVSHMSFGSLSKEAKLALAKGSAISKVAMSSGEGGILKEEREASYKYIFEYASGHFGVTEEALRNADAIEIKIGQAAKAGLGGFLPGKKVTEEIAEARNVEAFQDVISPENHDDILNEHDLRNKVNWLRSVSDGAPIGIKIVAGQLEDDLDIATFAEPDYITIDCRGGSTGATPTHVKDNFGISAPFATYQARKYLDDHQNKNTTLIITGGLRTSADIAKCLAMGADAIALGTTALIGIGCQQYRVCHKGTCPMGITTQDPKLRARLDVKQSAQMLANLFEVYKSELEDYVRIIGKSNIHDLNSSDLVTYSREISEHTNISHV